MREPHVSDQEPEMGVDVRPADFWIYLSLLWIAGNDLRVTVLSVPPLVPTIHRALHLNETAVGALTSLPVLLLAAAAIPGSLIIARLGARRALVVGLCLIGIAGAFRGLGSSTPVLFLMTFLMGIGIATGQPSLPTLVKFWFPRRLGVSTAAYTNGMLIGEIAAAALTASVLLPLLGQSWQWALAVWSAPVLLTAIAVVTLTPHVNPAPDAPPAQWWPDWRSGSTWQLGLILGCASTAYFGTNAFIPDYLKAEHHAGLVTAGLTSLNVWQLPASFIIAGFTSRLVGRRWPIVSMGALLVIATVGIAAAGPWVVPAAGLVGFCSAFVFVFGLTLGPLIASAGDIHRLSAAMFTISYACAFVSSLLGGAIWDLIGIPFSAFAPVILAGVAMAGLGMTIRPNPA